MRDELQRGLVDSLPIVLGFIPFGFLLGARAAQKGLSQVEVPLMTGLNFAGGSEFAVIQLWSRPPDLILIAAITFLINSRHLLMGATLAPYLAYQPRRKILPALFVMCDESWALGLADIRRRKARHQKPVLSLPYYIGAALVLYVAWTASAAIGVVFGPILGSVETFGLDMAFPAVFLVILRSMWQGAKAARPWLVSLVVAALTYRFVPGAWYVVAGAISGVAAASILAKDA